MLQRIAVAVLLLAAAIPRGRNLDASFDREASGERGVRAALVELNAQRLPDIEAAITALEIPDGTDRYIGLGEPPWASSVWRSDSALAADLAIERVALEFFEVDFAEPDSPVEFAIRVPFLALHLLALFLLWWAVAQAMGGQIALLTLALLTVMPPSLMFGSLTGTESFALCFAALLVGLYAHHVRKRAWWSLVLLAPVSFGAALVAPETLAISALIPVHALVAKRVREGLAALVLMVGPIVLLVRFTEAEWLAPLTELLPRAESRIGEWLDFFGSLAADSSSLFTPIVFGIAGLGIALRISRCIHANWRTRLEALEFPAPTEPRIELGGLLLAFGLLAILVSPKESSPRLLLLVPAMALGVALFLQQLTRPIAAMKAGIAPLVVLASLIAMPCLARFAGYERAISESPTPRELGTTIRNLDLAPNEICVIPNSLAQGRALEFYARRSLVPQSYLDRAEAGSVAVKRGILPWTLTVLLPVKTEREDSKDVATLRMLGAERMELESSSELWEIWR